MIWAASGRIEYDQEGLIVDLAVSHDADLPKPGTRVRILGKMRERMWSEKTGVIVPESEVIHKTAYKGEVYVKLDYPLDTFSAIPFRPDEFEVIE